MEPAPGQLPGSFTPGLGWLPRAFPYGNFQLDQFIPTLGKGHGGGAPPASAGGPGQTALDRLGVAILEGVSTSPTQTPAPGEQRTPDIHFARTEQVTEPEVMLEPDWINRGRFLP